MEAVPLAARARWRSVRKGAHADDLLFARRDLRRVQVSFAEGAVEVADPLAIDREDDVRLVDEVGAQDCRVVPAPLVQRLVDLAVG
jgi:hypothetical protein